MKQELMDAILKGLVLLEKFKTNPPVVDAEYARMYAEVVSMMVDDPQIVEAGVKRLLTKGDKWWPAPAEFIAACNEARIPSGDVESGCAMAYAALLEAISRLGYGASYGLCDFNGDGFAVAAVSKIGMLELRRDANRRAFNSMYNGCVKNGEWVEWVKGPTELSRPEPKSALDCGRVDLKGHPTLPDHNLLETTRMANAAPALPGREQMVSNDLVRRIADMADAKTKELEGDKENQ